ncbi:hypothetical protein L2E82_06049 [Cichorium intybus]|uniref:Uncharacterized protein n=1 Tax=Cichorium intybus TaxID=13427 RepID=A0ACB9H9Q1_CICIN|nr:hypothetical protein L2E82_06049 [Cichorium intybus]
MDVMIRWWMMYDFTMNRLREAAIIREKYFMSYHNRRDNMIAMVYESDVMSVVNIRMNRNTFTILCDMLEQRWGLHKEFYKKPVPIPDDETDETDYRWKWFKGCLGALDGTYIKVRVPEASRKPYRTRKAGWEGSAADSRVLRDAISRPHGLKIPHGTYYLCDAGYTNGEGFLTPYRGQRYHLNDWSRPPRNAKELYNKRHSSARNVIERCFGLLKIRWAILRDTSSLLVV